MATPGPINNQGTPISSRFPPTNASQLVKDRGAQKQRHTKLVSKIRALIEQRGDTNEVSQLRQKLSEVYESIEAIHRKLIGAPDYKPDDEEKGYIENVRKLTTDVRREVEQYVQLSQTTRHNESAKPKTRSSSVQTGGVNDRNEKKKPTHQMIFRRQMERDFRAQMPDKGLLLRQEKYQSPWLVRCNT